MVAGGRDSTGGGDRRGGGEDVGVVVGVAREGLEAGGDVYAVADNGVVEAAVGADVAGDDAGGIEADAEGELRVEG